MPEAIIFDLDDTLITWDAVSAEVWGNICHRFAPEIEGVAPGQINDAIQRVNRWFWSDPERHRQGRIDLFETRRRLVQRALSGLGIDSPGLARKIADTYNTEREDAAFIVPEALGTLIALRKKGIRLAMITNGMSEIQRAKIDRFGLEPYFESIIVEGEFGRGKPDHDVFLHTMRKLGVSAKATWMVGDDLVRDIAPCRELGIFSVWVDGRNQGLPEGEIRPDRTVHNISEILEIV